MKKWNNLIFKEKIIMILGLAIVIAVILAIIGLTTSMGAFKLNRIFFGAIYVLFLPGFLLTYIFFPNKHSSENKIDLIERIALSFALSIAIVPLFIFYLNLIGMPISALSSFLAILTILLMGTLIILNKIRKNY